MNEYFVREGLEYVERLIGLLEADAPVDADAALRLAAGVRGCIRMADAERLTGLADELEASARTAHGAANGWSAAQRALTLRTARQLDHLLRALDEWGPGESAEEVVELLGSWHPDDPADPVPVSQLFYDDEGPHILDGSRSAEAPETGTQEDPQAVVPVSDLFFRGEAALREALALRPRLEATLAGAADHPPARRAELLDELFDLIELGLTTDADGG